MNATRLKLLLCSGLLCCTTPAFADGGYIPLEEAVESTWVEVTDRRVAYVPCQGCPQRSRRLAPQARVLRDGKPATPSITAEPATVIYALDTGEVTKIIY